MGVWGVTPWWSSAGAFPAGVYPKNSTGFSAWCCCLSSHPTPQSGTHSLLVHSRISTFPVAFSTAGASQSGGQGLPDPEVSPCPCSAQTPWGWSSPRGQGGAGSGPIVEIKTVNPLIFGSTIHRAKQRKGKRHLICYQVHCESQVL